MKWKIEFHRDFSPEFDALPIEVQDEMLAHSALLEKFGPQLGRPRVDTLKGSRHANMKELRFEAGNGVWRVAFAFDPKRRRSSSLRATSPGLARSDFTEV